jgi:hypothetical protein
MSERLPERTRELLEDMARRLSKIEIELGAIPEIQAMRRASFEAEAKALGIKLHQEVPYDRG